MPRKTAAPPVERNIEDEALGQPGARQGLRATGPASGAKPPAKTDESAAAEQVLGSLSNVQLAVLALLACEGDRETVGTEDIAVRLNDLAPGRFTWKKYRQQISLEHVRVVLSDAKKLDNGRLVSGTGTEGWHLTAAGLGWAQAHEHLLKSRAPRRQREDVAILHRRAVERARCQELSAWRDYIQGLPIAARDAEAVFRISSYTDLKRRTELIERFKILFIDDEEMSEFIQAVAEVAAPPPGGRNE